jgi:hypothetical protein
MFTKSHLSITFTDEISNHSNQHSCSCSQKSYTILLQVLQFVSLQLQTSEKESWQLDLRTQAEGKIMGNEWTVQYIPKNVIARGLWRRLWIYNWRVLVQYLWINRPDSRVSLKSHFTALRPLLLLLFPTVCYTFPQLNSRPTPIALGLCMKFIGWPLNGGTHTPHIGPMSRPTSTNHVGLNQTFTLFPA